MNEDLLFQSGEISHPSVDAKFKPHRHHTGQPVISTPLNCGLKYSPLFSTHALFLGLKMWSDSGSAPPEFQLR